MLKTSLQRMQTFTSPNYVFSDGLRHVDPYFQHIKTTVKTRWRNRTVLDVLSSEFRSISQLEYLKRIKKKQIIILHQQKLTKKEKKEQRRLTGSPKVVRKIEYPEIMDFKLQDNDVIVRQEHIHERSVYGVCSKDIEIVYEDTEILVINKPSGIPIHPVQNYYFNSLVKILEYEGWKNTPPENTMALRPCYRLDKLTSGVCIFAKSPETASRIQRDIQDREVEKVYIARVKGRFPENEFVCNDDVIVLDTKKGKTDGIMKKEAKTVFQRIIYNPVLNESIVRCLPKTGRTHQIRIHLRNLGHPISNDPLYGDGKLMSSSKLNDLSRDTDAIFDQIRLEAEVNRSKSESSELCKDCGVSLYTQTEANKLVIYLHAISYGLKDEEGWKYETKNPDWVNI